MYLLYYIGRLCNAAAALKSYSFINVIIMIKIYILFLINKSIDFLYSKAYNNNRTYEHTFIHSIIHIKWGGLMAEYKADIDKCDCNVIHEDIVKRVKGKMPLEENLYDLAELFKVFGDTTRIQLLWALDEAEMCVCDLAVLLNMTQSAISHQLRVLKQARLVKYRRDGKTVYYSLDDEHVKEIFDKGLSHITE
jgi:Predicted transcriptional regulators